MHNILITGGSGMVGSAFRKYLPTATYLSSSDCDLRERLWTMQKFQYYEPEIVIHLAGKVGGVKANSDFVGDFYRDNILINTNVMDATRFARTKKVVLFLSTCIYPDKASYPLTEDQIHSGEPHYTNFGYAYAKRMLEVQARAYAKQYRMNCICVVPNNLFGENDNYDLENGHVLPALIRKVYEAKINKTPLSIWGDGEVYREFTYADDIVKIVMWLLEQENIPSPINIGNPTEYYLKDVIAKVCSMFDYTGEVIYDSFQPKGQVRKPCSNQKLLDLGWKGEYTYFDLALKEVCRDFERWYPKLRGINVHRNLV